MSPRPPQVLLALAVAILAASLIVQVVLVSSVAQLTNHVRQVEDAASRTCQEVVKVKAAIERLATPGPYAPLGDPYGFADC